MSSHRIVLFQDDRILLRDGALPAAVPEGAEHPPLGPLDARLDPGSAPLPVWTWPSDKEVPDGLAAHSLRAAFPLLGQDLGPVGRAAHLLRWRRTDRFCGACGSPSSLSSDGRHTLCGHCGQIRFPQLAPAMIVLIHDGDRALLGRGSHYPEGMYSTLAGFVEPGESLEDAVRREVREEAGVEVDSIRYRGSQHWPFPHSLMVGFHARWVGGEARAMDDELEDVAWFRADEMPRIPPRESIAHQLISEWLRECGTPG